MIRVGYRVVLGAALAAALSWSLPALAEDEVALAPSGPKVPGLGDPGKLSEVSIGDGADLVLRGPDARLQLVVSGKYSSGQFRDLTHDAQFKVEPEGIVKIDESGLATPIGDGVATITVIGPDGVQGKSQLKVENFTNKLPINFPNQIVPIFTKLGCNSGGCHGKASGQNGFKLSLLGFYPNEDFEYLVKEGRGRRLFPAAPDASLLLLKATDIAAHGGGRRLEKDSYEYRLMRRWIAQGMPYGSDSDPKVASIEVIPPTRTMDRGSEQQISVIAHYTDGSIEDVTRMAQYEPNDPEMAECTEQGLVKTRDLTGEVAIMARYQGNVSVFRASIPLGLEVDNAPKSANFIDDLVFGKLKSLGVPPSAVCDDATFIRRVSVDIAGKLPSAQESQVFVEDQDPNKREKLVGRLLSGTGYADYFANKWSAVLRNKRRNNNQTKGTYAFHAWIRESLHRNKPYDEFVRDVLAASGEMTQNPPVVWYREVKTAEQQLEDAAQLFLGLRIQCARCHHHPFERWSQDDYYGFAAFFSRVGRKNGINGLPNQDDQRIFHNRGVAQARNPRSGANLKPTGLGGEPVELTVDDDPRLALVDWMADPENPFFAKALVNRYWKHFFSRGIVDPEDDMRVTNPASNPELLDALAKHFIEHKFDLKDLVKTICMTKTYQLSAEPNEFNVKDKQLNAEVLYDAIFKVTNGVPSFGGLPRGTRAVQLPDTGVNSYFLTVFGKPQADSACECERSAQANMAQSLHLLHTSEIQGRLAAGDGRAALLAKDNERSDDQKLSELYYWVYSRAPDAEELKITLNYLASKENKQQAYEDILWALINSKEFLFNH